MDESNERFTAGSGLTENAIRYTIICILNIAGVPAEQYSVDGNVAKFEKFSIRFSVMSSEEIKDFFAGEAPVKYINSFDGQVEIPLFGSQNFYAWQGTELLICADILTASFALLSRYEEIICKKRDQYGRFSFCDSLAKKYGFIDLPIVDEYAMLLRLELEKHGLKGQLKSRKANFVPTHDVDEIWRFHSLPASIKSILGGDIILRKSLKIALHSIKELAFSRLKPERDPYYLACRRLMDISLKNGLISTFYFLGYGDEKDRRYDIMQPSVHQLMKEIDRNHCVVGFHGGFGTYNDGDVYTAQKSRVNQAYGQNTRVGRQHYLCFDAGKTPKIWEENGIREDQTLSFFDREGFRCGTCHPYPLYDFKEDHPLSVIERPLLLMDGTVREYRHLSIEEALSSARTIWERVLAVRGDFVILWHNNSIGRGMETWFEKFYCKFLGECAQQLKEQKDVE